MTHWLETATKEQIEDVLQVVRDIPGFQEWTHTSLITDEQIIKALANDRLPLDMIIRKVKEQWLGICLAAVRQNGFALAAVKDKTKEIIEAEEDRDSDFEPYIKNGGKSPFSPSL